MHPAPTAEQQALKDAVERFCREQITPERLRAWERAPRGIDADCWQAIADLGWFGLGLPEHVGGSGFGLVEIACLLEECGRGLIPHSVIGAIRAGWALARLDPQAPELEALARGQRTVTLALDEEACREPERYQTRVEERGGTLRISGCKWYVPNGLHADWQVVGARAATGVTLVLVAREHANATPLRTFDGEEQAIIRYSAAPGIRSLGQAGALERLRREETALALAEMVGGMRAVIDRTVAYVKEREQFGQKIAVFQAVQHQVADMATAYTASRHLAWQAISRLAAGTALNTDIPSAAAFVGQAYKKVTLTAHHLHGGAGYVLEHPLHYYAERAQALCIRYAPEAPALAAIARELLD